MFHEFQTFVFADFVHIHNMVLAWLLHEQMLKSSKIKC